MLFIIPLELVCLWDVRIYCLSVDCNFISHKNTPWKVDQNNRSNKGCIELTVELCKEVQYILTTALDGG
jgi:hypothetical protein